MEAGEVSAASPSKVRAEVRDYYHRILPFYDAELRDRGDGDFWTWAAAEPRPARVLELGSGTGRATAFLARSAARVVGFDLSPELVAVARRKLAGCPNVALFTADMRDFSLRENFDLVTAVDDPFSHLIDDLDRARAFAAAARHLQPDGRFLVDAAWFSPQARRQSAGPEGFVREHSVRRPGTSASEGNLVVHQVWRCDPDSRICSARFEYRTADATDAGTKISASFQARLWS